MIKDKKTSEGLVLYVKQQLGKPYWYGCFGQISSEKLYLQKKKQAPFSTRYFLVIQLLSLGHLRCL